MSLFSRPLPEPAPTSGQLADAELRLAALHAQVDQARMLLRELFRENRGNHQLTDALLDVELKLRGPR